jgi:heat shock protein HslJ
MHRALLPIVAVLALAACQQRPAAPEPEAPAVKTVPLRSVEWTCTWISAEGTTLEPPADGAPTLRIEPPADATGFAGVNRFGGTAELAAGEPGPEGAIRFPALGATKMAGPPERMALERAYFAALRNAARYRISGTELLLEGSSGPVVRFRAGP